MPKNNPTIHFFTEGISFTLKQKKAVKSNIIDLIKSEKKELSNLNIIFCSDAYLLEINIKYLNHNYLTDIITFQYADNPIEGELFISIDRVKENAKKYNQIFENELLRIIFHGTLHLVGYKDNTTNLKKRMTAKEDYYLQHYSK